LSGTLALQRVDFLLSLHQSVFEVKDLLLPFLDLLLKVGALSEALFTAITGGSKHLVFKLESAFVSQQRVVLSS